MSSRFSRYRAMAARHRRLGRWSLGVLAAICIVVAILTSFFVAAQWIVPGYRNLIAKRLSTQLHAPVTLGGISLGWHDWGPELDLQQLTVRSSKTHEVVLSAARLRLDFPLSALVHGADARPSAIDLDQPHLTLVQTPTGGFRVPGVHFIGVGPGAGMLGVSIGARNGTLKLQFNNAHHKPWTFAPLDLEVGGGKTHAVKLTAGLPKVLGGRELRVVGKVTTPKLNPGSWQWRGQVALEKLPLTPLDPFLPAGWQRPTGVLAFRIGLQGEGFKVARASGRVTAANLAVGDGRLPQFATQFTFATEAGGGLRLALNDSVLKLPKQTWRPGKVVFTRAGDGRLRVQVATMKLAALPPLAKFLPPGHKKFVARLEKMKPTGDIRSLDVALTPGHLETLALGARLDDVGVHAAGGAPGFNHLAATIHMRHGMGTLALDAPGFTMRMPHLFTHTVPLDRLRGKIGIALTAKAARLAISGLHITGPKGLDGSVIATITIPRQGPVHVRLAAWAAPLDSNAARPLYIPTGLLSKRLTAWLMHQLQDGKAGPMSLRFVGDAKRFPFQHGGGHFHVAFGVHGVGLRPGAGWAPITNLSGTVHFENAAMHADIVSGKIEGARVLGAHATIPDLFHPQLGVNTTIAGTLPDFIAFLKKSPVASKVGSVFKQFKVAGKARTSLRLQLPIKHPKRLQLAGKIVIDHAKIVYARLPWPIEDLSGQLTYDEHGPTAGKLTASLLDTPIHIALARSQGAAGGALTLRFGGRFPVTTLARAAGTGFSRYASGTVPLQATLVVPLATAPFPFTVNFSSNLQGLKVRLPAPVGKSAIAKRSLTARLRVAQGTLGIEARYANVASVCADLAYGGKKPKLEAGELVLGAGGCKGPVSGLSVRGGWRELDVKPWLAVLPKGKKKAGVGAFNLDALRGLKLDLRFGAINVLGQRLKNQGVQGSLGSASTKLVLDGPDLSGTITVPHHPTNATPITAALTHAHIALSQEKPESAKAPASAAAAPKKLASVEASVNKAATANKSSGSLKPGDIPPFVLSAKQFQLGSAALSDVKIVARRVPSGVVIKPIHVGGGSLKFEGQMAWLNPPASGEQGALQFVANVSHLGALLAGLGVGAVVTGHGALSAALAWHQPRRGGKAAQGLLGKVSTDLRDGNISKVSPGAGRLLSLLSLVNIPRYLVFNFHNLFSKGFPFSRIYGDYDIKHGIAHTDGLKIESSIANIDIKGKVNLVNNTMDQTAEVAPNYFGSLPVIGAIVGGLGVGAAIFALVKLFGGSLSKALGMKYTIQGPIDKPIVKKVGAPSPQSTPAAASAGGQ
ncbi:MAG: YhdP family protein [Gammaproteobacteria bacterium]